MVVLLRSILPLLLLAFWIWAAIDVIRTDETGIEYLPKIVWLLLVLFFPLVGAIAWVAVGRPTSVATSWTPPRRRAAPPLEGPRQPPDETTLSPESREEAIRRYYEDKRLRDEAQDRHERELWQADDPQPPPPEDGGAGSEGA